ncbi:MAG: hypothetical protein KC505_05935 [Myxococcales bacterium]|nr:hypothetical protein [Myxococcales bacterium]USN51269.1 MAG: hypothetical protein H6731_02360 [Myxococcales bacterium]
MTETGHHEKIIPTAKLVAYCRKSTDIPYAQDVATLFKAQELYETSFSMLELSELNISILSTLLELRYKCIQNYLVNNSFKQVLEFASGISLRGLSMTKDPDMVYVETDLEALNSEKQNLLDTIKNKHGIKNRNNLFFHPANILDMEQIKPALKHFDPHKKLGIINEGLFPYLNRDEKLKAAKNIRSILEKFEGSWITPDMESKKSMHGYILEQHQQKNFLSAIEEKTGCNFSDNAFEDENDVKIFFSELGFNVECIPQLQNGIKLSSLEKIAHSKTAMEHIENLRLWIFRLKKINF